MADSARYGPISYLLAAGAMFMTSRSAGWYPDRTFAPSAVARDLITGARVLRGQPVARASSFPVTVVFLMVNASPGPVLMPFGIERLGGSEHTGSAPRPGVGFLAGA